MARIRSVHPGLFTDEAFVALSEPAQILFIGLWTEADDQGVFEWKPLTLRMRLRPTKDGDVEGLLAELTAVDAIAHYEYEGRKYGAIRNFRRYQRPKSPKSVHPIPSNFRNYVGLTPTSSETPEDDGGGCAPKGGNPSAEGGGRLEDEGVTHPSDGAAPKMAPHPPDVKTEVFGSGVQWLSLCASKSIQATRRIVGRWCRDYGDGPVFEALMAAQRNSPVEPVAYIERLLRGGGIRDGPASQARQQALEDEVDAMVTQAAKEADKRNGKQFRTGEGSGAEQAGQRVRPAAPQGTQREAKPAVHGGGADVPGSPSAIPSVGIGGGYKAGP